MPTNVPSPIFGDRGFVLPTEAAILAGVQADINTALGGGVNPGLSTPQGQIASTMTAIIGDKNDTFLWMTQQVDPALNSGRMQDAIGRVYFMQRIAGQPTVVLATCSGLTGAVIPVGALAVDVGNVLYVCVQRGTIPPGGSVVLAFACAQDGPTVCPAGTLTTIYSAIPGWDSVTNLADGALGRLVETRSEFEARRAASVALNARGILDSIQAAVLAVPGVLDAFVTENVNDEPIAVYGFLGFGEQIDGFSGFNFQPFYSGQEALIIGAHSIFVCVLGGAPQDVANAIWTKKPPGAGYNGNTTLSVADPSPRYLPPVPTYFVSYEIPELVDFAVQVTLKNNQFIPSNALTLIQGVVVAAFAGTDNGPPAKIGSTVFGSRFYGGVLALGTWAQVVEIEVGLSGRDAGFTASIAGTTMTVTAMEYGSILAGQMLQDDPLGNLLTGSLVVRQLTGSAGNVGLYQVTPGQTVASEAMNCTNLLDDITMNINQAPVVAPVNVSLVVQR